jgi:hypothetical protein
MATFLHYDTRKDVIEVLQNAVVIASLPRYKFASFEPELAALANDAINNPAQNIAVPCTSNARGVKPRNLGKQGISLF